MKKLRLLSIILGGGICCLGLTNCSDDDENIAEGGNPPAQKILAVGFDTEKPVQKINYFHPGESVPMQSLVFTWSGKNITALEFQGYDSETKQYVTYDKYEYHYQGQEVLCQYYMLNEEGKLELTEDGSSKVQLDQEGYAKSCTNKTYRYDLYGEGDASRRIDYTMHHTYQVERDDDHRVTLLVHSSYSEYLPEDLQWLKDQYDYDYDPTGVSHDSIPFEYDAKGNLMQFTQEYTDLPNVNGFNLVCMHAYHFPRSLTPICMGPYDLFHVVKTPNLPAHFEHELYKYEVDKDGYVTKVYDLRDWNEDLTQAPYSVFEY